MQHPIKNILIINAGGGIGDAIQFIKIFELINQEFKNPNIDYYGNDLNNFWFDNKLSSLKAAMYKLLRTFLFISALGLSIYSIKKLEIQNLMI